MVREMVEREVWQSGRVFHGRSQRIPRDPFWERWGIELLTSDGGEVEAVLWRQVEGKSVEHIRSGRSRLEVESHIPERVRLKKVDEFSWD